MSLSNYAEQYCLAALLAGHTLYVGLSQTAPGETGSSNTPPGGNYARLLLADYSIVSGVLTNNADLAFAVASVSWGTITHATIWDSPTGGNMLAWTALAAGVPIPQGGQFTISAGNLSLYLD